MAKPKDLEQTVEELTTEDQKKLRAVQGYTEQELKVILKQTGRQPVPPKSYRIGQKNVRFGVISDTHIGNKCFDEGLMDFAAREFHRRKVDFVVHSGDIADGLYTHRPGHVFELDHIGADDQTEESIRQLEKLRDLPLFFITGNHTWNTFYKNAGVDIGKRLDERLAHATYLGNARGTIEVANGVTIDLMHPDGGTAYAISYKSQKIVESFTGGRKPNVLIIGHFHKAEYLFYRNVHVMQAGCLESQTPYMAGKHIPAHKGFWIVTLKTNRTGIATMQPEFYPAYD